jgi:hypothetical protein
MAGEEHLVVGGAGGRLSSPKGPGSWWANYDAFGNGIPGYSPDAVVSAPLPPPLEEDKSCSSEEKAYASAMHAATLLDDSEYHASKGASNTVNGKTATQWFIEIGSLQLKIENTNSAIMSLEGADRGRQYYIAAIRGIEDKFANLPAEIPFLSSKTWRPLGQDRAALDGLYLFHVRDSTCKNLTAGGSGEVSHTAAHAQRTKNIKNMSSYPKLYNSGWGAEDLNRNVTTYLFATRVLPDMDLNYIRLNALLYGKGCLKAGGSFAPFANDNKSGYIYELKIAKENYAKAMDLEKTSTSKIAAAKERLANRYQAYLNAYSALMGCYRRHDRVESVVKPELPA